MPKNLYKEISTPNKRRGGRLARNATEMAAERDDPRFPAQIFRKMMATLAKKQGTQEKEDSGKEMVVDRNGRWWCD